MPLARPIARAKGIFLKEKILSLVNWYNKLES